MNIIIPVIKVSQLFPQTLDIRRVDPPKKIVFHPILISVWNKKISFSIFFEWKSFTAPLGIIAENRRFYSLVIRKAATLTSFNDFTISRKEAEIKQNWTQLDFGNSMKNICKHLQKDFRIKKTKTILVIRSLKWYLYRKS